MAGDYKFIMTNKDKRACKDTLNKDSIQKKEKIDTDRNRQEDYINHKHITITI